MNEKNSTTDTSVTVICLGDVVGRPGRMALQKKLGELRDRHHAHCVIANGENAAGGTGIDISTAREILESGVNVVTLGDHTWQRKEIKPFLEDNADRVIRPANYPEGAPGRGWTIHTVKPGISIGVFNLMGRVFLNIPLDCPFTTAENILNGPLKDCTVRIGDMHAEATSEKVAMGRLLDGRCSMVFGTHTHVQTADEQILPGGTGYITDLGMSGSPDGVIGMRTDVAINRLRSGIPQAYEIAPGEGVLSGVCVTIDSVSGKALSIERIRC